jgi:hypothetical protein
LCSFLVRRRNGASSSNRRASSAHAVLVAKMKSIVARLFACFVFLLATSGCASIDVNSGTPWLCVHVAPRPSCGRKSSAQICGRAKHRNSQLCVLLVAASPRARVWSPWRPATLDVKATDSRRNPARADMLCSSAQQRATRNRATTQIVSLKRLRATGARAHVEIRLETRLHHRREGELESVPHIGMAMAREHACSPPRGPGAQREECTSGSAACSWLGTLEDVRRRRSSSTSRSRILEKHAGLR